MMRFPLTMAKLSCGECIACCHAFEINDPKLTKSEGCDCPHLLPPEIRKVGGCSIHMTRPDTCRDFNCHWLLGKVHDGKLKYRPDKLGLIIRVIETAPLNGILGLYRINAKVKLNSTARALFRKLEATQLFFFEEKLRGPKKLRDAWLKKWNVVLTD